MRRPKYIEPWVSDAFLIWLEFIGYRIVPKGMHSELLPKYKCKNLPRGGCIQCSGKMNKVAKTLFAEFKEHLEA